MKEKGPSQEIQENKSVSSDLAGQTFNFYFKIFRWPLLGVLLVEIVLIVLDQKLIYLWFVNLIFFVGLTLWIKYIYKVRLAHIVVLNGLSGFILGFLMALFKLIWTRKGYLIFNLITESFITLFFGVLISAATFMIITKDYKNHSILPFKLNKKKGGGSDGRETKNGGKPRK
ncbi:MAG: hypothetical protein U5L76_03820 [Patescibacteria group bacterium]|nr:hypothetical protein [Patescibacteria group bacterium]